MYLAYVDESGDRGKDGSQTYVLACVLVRAARWNVAFDGIIGFRRYLKATFGIPVRSEIKANYLLRNGGDFRALGLSEHARRFVYTGMMRLQASLQLSTFAVVIEKSRLRNNAEPFIPAWTFLLQRLERLSTDDKEQILVVHDEGEPETIRKLARKARRAGTAGSMFGGYLNVPFPGLLDDPVSRNSHQSYFLQLADLNAYAAYRKVHPPPQRRIQIVSSSTWDELGTARRAAVSKRVGGPSAGIVWWPRR